MIENPILCGFNPDPSILRVKDDYYIATSTFEWLPGIQIHHSKDLSHWRLLTHAITRETQINLQGVAPSKGVWAPCLTFKDDQFWLAYSLVRCITDNFFDLDNFLITAPEITGPWSDPIYLNSSGFDPSLFHDEDGRKWLVNLEWDFRIGYEHPGALVLQEYDSKKRQLIGKPKQIYRGGSELGCLEGPHLFRRGSWYYLMAAEGGTGYGHGVTMARAHELEGPWEKDAHNPILTSAAHAFNARGNPQYLKPEHYNPDSYLQKSGHGSLVETPEGEAYIAHLCARPIMPEMRCMLGRETSLQKAYWTPEGWLTLGKSNLAQKLVPEPALPVHPWAKEPELDNFDTPVLNDHWAAPRRFIENSWADLKVRPGYLRLIGGESLFSTFKQSLVARRIQHFNFTAATSLEFTPQNFQEMAGLVCLYDTMNFYYLRLYWSQSLGSKALGLFTSDNGKRAELSDARVKIRTSGPIYLKVQVSNKKLQFSWSEDEKVWQLIGPAFDATKLSDEYCHTGEFTGAFVGICAQDLACRKAYADFDWFSYSPK